MALATDEERPAGDPRICDAGITSLRVEPEGKTFDERLQTLACAIEIVKGHRRQTQLAAQHAAGSCRGAG